MLRIRQLFDVRVAIAEVVENLLMIPYQATAVGCPAVERHLLNETNGHIVVAGNFTNAGGTDCRVRRAKIMNAHDACARSFAK